MDMGVGEYFICLALCTVGYGCLTLCIAEMAGIIAFSGGSFGYARCTLSPFIGYLVGMCDLLQCVLITSCSVYSVSRLLNIAVTKYHSGLYIPLLWIGILHHSNYNHVTRWTFFRTIQSSYYLIHEFL